MKQTLAKKRAMPDMAGQQGVIVATGIDDLVFGHKMRVSPYDAMLSKLLFETKAALPTGGTLPALRFPNSKPYASLMVRSKKMGVRLQFATRGEELFARIVFTKTPAEREQAILDELKQPAGPRTPIGLAALLRERGDDVVDGQMIGALLGSMQKRGLVIAQEGGKWRWAQPRP